MSATLGKDLGERLAALLGDNDDGAAPQPAPLLVSAGRQFPVKVTHLGSAGLPGQSTLHLAVTLKLLRSSCICLSCTDASWLLCCMSTRHAMERHAQRFSQSYSRLCSAHQCCHAQAAASSTAPWRPLS